MEVFPGPTEGGERRVAMNEEKKQYVSTRNACKLCSPLGACFAMRGIEGCIPLIHGS